jgi:hypothetical protein
MVMAPPMDDSSNERALTSRTVRRPEKRLGDDLVAFGAGDCEIPCRRFCVSHAPHRREVMSPPPEASMRSSPFTAPTEIDRRKLRRLTLVANGTSIV